jgi:hypothetical protein
LASEAVARTLVGSDACAVAVKVVNTTSWIN